MSSTAFSERAQALHERLDAPEPTTWRHDDPDHPKLLIGQLVAVSAAFVRSGPAAGQKRQIAILRNAEGQLWSVWLLHKVLIDEFLVQQPKIGEMLAIRYDGRVVDAALPYEKFRLVVDREGGTVEWTAATGVPTDTEVAAPAEAAFVGAPPVVEPPAETPPAAAGPVVCDACQMANGYHAAGCPLATDDIPF